MTFTFHTALSEAWVEDCKVFVLSNKKNFYGATVLFYPGVMDALYKSGEKTDPCYCYG